MNRSISPRQSLIVAISSLFVVTACVGAPAPVPGPSGSPEASAAATVAPRPTPTGSIPTTAPVGTGLLDAGLAPNGIGWAITSHGVEVSTDRGKTWSSATPPGVDPTSIRSVDVGLWPTVHMAAPEGDHVRVFASADGGITWTSTTGPKDGAPDGFMDAKVQFIDAKNGFVEAVFATNTSQSLAELLRTTDGGKTWSPANLPVAGPIEFGSLTDGWLDGGTLGGQLFRTGDGGRTWTAVKIAVPTAAAGHNAWPLLPAIIGDQVTMPVVFAVDGGGTTLLGVYVSHDGGTNWDPAEPPTMLSVDGSGGAIGAAPGFVLAASSTAKGFLSITTSPGAGVAPVTREVPSTHGSGSATSATDTASQDLHVLGDGTAWSLEMYSACRAFKDCSIINTLWASSDRGASWSELHP